MEDAASTVFAPRGGRHAGPQPGGDGILFADLELADGTWANLVNRHYDRPDLLRLVVDRRPRPDAMTVVRGDADATPAEGVAAAEPAERVRREIAERFGDRLSAAEVDELVPYVRGVRESGAQLASLGLDGIDPSAVSFALDERDD